MLFGVRRLGGVGLGREVLAGRHALGALEDPREVELVKEAHRDGDFGDGQIARPQQLAGLVDPVVGQIINGALADVQHEHPVQMAAGDAHALGDIVDGDIVRIIELDVLDGVEHILAGGRGAVGLGLAGLLHQGGDEQVQVAHHGGFVLRLEPAGGVDVGQGCAHPVGVAGVVDGLLVGKGELRGQFVRTCAIKAHPAVLPRLLLVGGVADELARPGKEQITGGDGKGAPAHFKGAPARNDKVDQVVVPDAGAPCLARSAPLQAAVEDGQFDVVGVILFEGLLVNVWHRNLLPSAALLSSV